jgi:hypothetical protein
MRRTLPLLLLATAVVGACSKGPAPAKIPLSQMSAEDPSQNAPLTGTVLEQLAAPPYIYVRVKTAKGEIWAAVPETKVEKGAQVTVYSPMLMSNFESKSLNRTFPEVYFGTLEPTAAAAGAAGADPHAGAAQPVAAVDVGNIPRATGANAHTVAEVWEQKASLEGKTVTIRGKVVKHNDGVMGKNWIHLQDGSGDADKGTNDITVTSADFATTGETVTITGTVRLNKDFGYGYTYPVIVEDAKVLKQL